VSILQIHGHGYYTQPSPAGIRTPRASYPERSLRDLLFPL
jgi:hypothetical protein